MFLEARNVSKVFGQGEATTIALEDFSYQFAEDAPAITAVAGESGSGKSTLARLLLGFIRPTEGQVFYRGKDLRQLSRQERKNFRREVQAVFQDPFGVYNPFYKIDHLLTTPIKNFKMAASRADARRQIDDALLTVGLNPVEILGRYPHQLSGGQRQRITIARALLLRPRLIIADEPVSMVDASLRATILESLLTLYRDFGISFMYITHDLTTAYQIAERLIVLYQGSVAEAGPVEQIVAHPQHPYTQLLIHSIPAPDPDRRWSDDAISIGEAGDATENPGAIVHRGCKFAPRCPHAMPMCRNSAPPLFTSEGVAVSCYLYRKSAVADGHERLTIAGEKPNPNVSPLPTARRSPKE
ncbi:MAG: ABC transporter ATP-binding protein [Thermomicrobiales bacterium]